MTVYARPGTEGSLMSFSPRYENYIGGEWVTPTAGRYFENVSPVTGQPFCEIPRSDAADIEKALDAAHAAAPAWGKTTAAERAVILNKIADRIEGDRESIAVAESWANGKPVRETLNADIPLAVDHFRYFAGAIRAQEGSLSQIDDETVAYHFHEPLGVVGQIIPWNFPILLAAWKLAPALAAGNTIVLKPAEQTPLTALRLARIAEEAGLPPGVLNVVTGFGPTAGAALVDHPGVDKIAFTGSTAVGQETMRRAAGSLKRLTLELGGKSPNIVFADADIDQAVRGASNGIFYNKGEVCTAGSRLFLEDSLHDAFLDRLQ